jgi:hypothetical protein
VRRPSSSHTRTVLTPRRRKVAQALAKHGFSVLLDNPLADRSITAGGSYREIIHTFVRGADWRVPWSAYPDRPTRGLAVPPLLHGDLPMRFVLRPASPGGAPLLALLRAYTDKARPLLDELALLFLWAQSHGLTALSPAVLALMLINNYQVRVLSQQSDLF